MRLQRLESKVTSDGDLSRYFFGYWCASKRHLKFARHSANVVLEKFVLSSLITSPLMKPLFCPRRVARAKMGILKGFHRLVVSFNIYDGFFYVSLSFEHHCIQEGYFVL